VGHGRFERWLQVHFPASDDTARDYMKVAENWGRFPQAKSIRAYLRAIADDGRRCERGEGCPATENTLTIRAREIKRQFRNEIRDTITDALSDDQVVYLATDGHDIWEDILEGLFVGLKEQLAQRITPTYRDWKASRNQENEEHLRRTTFVPDRDSAPEPIRRRRVNRSRLPDEVLPVEEGTA